MAIDPELTEVLTADRQPWWRIVVNTVPPFLFVVGLSWLESGNLSEQFVMPVTMATIAGLAAWGWNIWRLHRREDEMQALLQREAAQFGFWVVMAVLASISLGQAIGWIGETIDGGSPMSLAFFSGLLAFGVGYFRALSRRVGAR